MAARRFRGHRQRATRFHPLAIVGICLCAAVLLTVLIGNILNLVVDDDTYHRLTGKEEEDSNPPPSYTANAPRVNAYPFVLGNAVEQVINSPAVAVMVPLTLSPLTERIASVSVRTGVIAGCRSVQVWPTLCKRPNPLPSEPVLVADLPPQATTTAFAQ